ncbi:hypothetical protein AAHE18_05G225900 [Arachis hypogaea]
MKIGDQSPSIPSSVNLVSSSPSSSLSAASLLLPAVTASPLTSPCSLLYWSFLGCASSFSTSLLLLLSFFGASPGRQKAQSLCSLRILKMASSQTPSETPPSHEQASSASS